MTTNFAAATKALAEGGVEFVIVGGYAAWLHGSVITTVDLDICYRRTKENMTRLARALLPLHPKLRGAEEVPFLLDERSLSQGMNFTFVTDLGDIDVLGMLSGAGGYEDIVSGAREIEVDGLTCKVASLADIIKSKRAAGRNKDLFALPELESLLELERRDESDESK